MLEELWHGTTIMLAYFVIAAGTALISRALFKIPNELFRKILHGILLLSLLTFVFGYETWWIAALMCVAFAIVVYPILMLLERIKGFSEFTTERKTGELKNSLILVFAMFAAVITVCWGLLGDRMLVLVSIYAWGFGDAAAALVGKQFGKHKITWKYADGKKSFEGSLAMYLVSFLSVMIILICRGGMDMVAYFVIPAIVAAVSTLSELVSKGGNDTVICPISSMVVLLPLVYLFGGLM